MIESKNTSRESVDIDFSKVDSLLGEGRLFKALQVVNGMIGCMGFRPALFAKIAEIYAAANESEQAARNYFYSGIRDDQALPFAKSHLELLEATIENRKGEALIGDVPKSLRKLRLESVPDSIVNDLKSAGMTDDALVGLFGLDKAASLRKMDTELVKNRKFSARLKEMVLVGAGIGAFVGVMGAIITVTISLIELAKWMFS